MELDQLKAAFFKPLIQCTLLDEEGYLIKSCNTLIQHKDQDVSYFETDVDIAEALSDSGMPKSKQPTKVMRVQKHIAGQKRIFDYELSSIEFEGEQVFCWIITDHTDQYNWKPKSKTSKEVRKIQNQPPSTDEKVLPRAGSVLIAEDDELNLLLLRSVLTGYGIRADFVRNGTTALEKYSEKDYDLLILDYQMPEMDGLAVVDKIRETDLSISIVMLTGHDIESDKLDGVNALLTKPLQKEALRSILVQTLGEKESY